VKIAVLIARLLLGLEFLIFGLNGFLHFIPMPPPSGLAGQYMVVMSETHLLVLVFALQVAGGLLLLSGQFVPLALVLLGPILVNVLEFHLLVAPAGLPLAVFTLVLWLVVFIGVRRAFSGIFASKVTA
jgi:putative oxidoreductase